MEWSLDSTALTAQVIILGDRADHDFMVFADLRCGGDADRHGNHAVFDIIALYRRLRCRSSWWHCVPTYCRPHRSNNRVNQLA
jgi:hypothetical protein